MTAQEQAEHLFDRVMLFSEQGRPDCVQAFMPMALSAYESLPSLNLGAHYDIGRLGEVSGDTALAAAEVDTILKKNPTHLLGLFLAAHVAKLRHDSTAERTFYRRFLAAEPSERTKSLPEYLAHANDIAVADGEARQLRPEIARPPLPNHPRDPAPIRVIRDQGSPHPDTHQQESEDHRCPQSRLR